VRALHAACCATKQAEAAGIARSTVYYLARPVSSADLELMRQIDRLHLEFPFAGARMLRGLLAGRRRVKTLMKRMGIEALYRRQRTTKPEPGTRSTRICCAAWRSCGRTKCGRWTSRIFPWRKALPCNKMPSFINIEIL
jgi:hypothetical protein